MKKIKKVQTDLIEGKINCTTLLNEELENAQFAYYIFRNEKRIHISWYQPNPSFSFDTEGAPGYYRIVGFVKLNDGFIESAKSNPIFANPVEASPDEFPLTKEDSIAFQLKGETWNFPALYYPSEIKSLFVLTPSAIDRSKMVLPVFSRWTWAAEGLFPGHALCVADPTLELSESLRLGWLIGNKEKCATTELADFVVKFAKSRGIPNEKIVFYGSSASGFSALALAACIEGSTAVAINSQTDALSYEISKQVSLIQEYCFNNLTQEEIRSNFSNRVDMAKRWESVEESRVFLVQNQTDTHHYNIHFAPFWKSLGGTAAPGVERAGKHTAWVYHQEGGHIPESKEMAQEIISMLKL